MSEVEAFLKLLDTTVKASRLSGTKTKQLSQDSLKISASYDTKIVSSFLKLNNSLKSASQRRISSLYVFDAIARANKGQKGREGLMEKMEGVVDSWVRGMLTDGQSGAWVEGREKMRKVLDIWTKGTTFPRECLDELERQLVVAASAEAPLPESTTPPFSPALPPLEKKKEESNGGLTNGQGTDTARTSSITSPPTAVGQLPPEIQKLLGIQAAQQQQNGNASPAMSTPAGSDLASILATLKPANTNTPPQGTASTPTFPHAPALPSAGLPIIDPTQLAALANLTGLPQAPGVPPPNLNALAGILGGARPSPPTSTYGGNASPAAGPAYGHSHPPHLSQAPHMPGAPGAPGAFPPFPPQSQNGGPSQFPPAQAATSRPYARPRSPPRRESAGEQWREHGRQASFDGRDAYAGRQRSRSPQRRGPGEWGSGNERAHGEAHTQMQSRDGPDWSRERDEWSGNRGGDRGRGRGGSTGRGRGGYGDGDRGQRGGSQDHQRDGGYGARAGPPRDGQPQAQQPVQSGGRAPLPPQPGKDEFGRDLPPNAASNASSHAAGPHISPHSARASLPPLPPSVPQPPPTLPSPTPPYAGATVAMPQRSPHQGAPFRPAPPARVKPTLENFDAKTFDPNQPASWAALAEAWEGTNGRQPNQMELMEWLMMTQMRGGMGGGGMGQMGGFGGGGAGGGMGMGGMNGMAGGGGVNGGMGGMSGMGSGMGGPGPGQGGYGGGYQTQ